MPELPEVETIVKDLRGTVLNKTIVTLKVFPGSERLFIKRPSSYFKKQLVNHSINHLIPHTPRHLQSLVV